MIVETRRRHVKRGYLLSESGSKYLVELCDWEEGIKEVKMTVGDNEIILTLNDLNDIVEYFNT